MDLRRGCPRIVLLGIGISLFALAGPAPAAEKREPLLPLVQLQGDDFICYPPLAPGAQSCSRGLLRETAISVFRNGRVIGLTNQGEYQGGDQPATKPAAATVREENLAPAQVHQLDTYLQALGIAGRRGECDPFPPDYRASLSTARYVLFWYAPDGRRSALSFGTGFTRACTPEILQIFHAVLAPGGANTPAAAH